MANPLMIWPTTRVGKRVVAVSGSIAIWTCVATLAVLLGGCMTTPTRSEQTTGPAATANSSEASGNSTADTVSQTGPKTDFHKTATERQRFQVHIDFGRVFESEGDFDAAFSEYQSALAVAEARRLGQLKPVDEALAHRRMGGALDQLGRFAQAEVHYKKALKLSPKDPRIWNDAGYSYYLQGKWTEAEGALRTAARFAPEDDRIRTNLGLTLAAAGRTKDALPLLSHTAGDAIGHMNLGYSLAATGQLDLARHQYETALAMRPDLELAHRALSQLDRQQSSTPGAGTETLVAKRAPATRAPVVDRAVKHAATGPIQSQPPMPTPTVPKAKAPAWVKPPASNPSASRISLPPLPKLPDP
jgi:Flp pilus assembly protein TadD